MYAKSHPDAACKLLPVHERPRGARSRGCGVCNATCILSPHDRCVSWRFFRWHFFSSWLLQFADRSAVRGLKVFIRILNKTRRLESSLVQRELSSLLLTGFCSCSSNLWLQQRPLVLAAAAAAAVRPALPADISLFDRQ